MLTKKWGIFLSSLDTILSSFPTNNFLILFQKTASFHQKCYLRENMSALENGHFAPKKELKSLCPIATIITRDVGKKCVKIKLKNHRHTVDAVEQQQRSSHERKLSNTFQGHPFVSQHTIFAGVNIRRRQKYALLARIHTHKPQM